MKCNNKATSRRKTGQLGNGCSSSQSGMMMVRVHGRQLGGMSCVDILAAESGGMVGFNAEECSKMG
jgi:hypothetical protein